MARKMYPMPVQCIIEHPAVLAMRAQTLGAFMRLVLHYWATECREMSETDREWAMISRGGEKLWKNHGAELRAVFAEIQPVLEAYRRRRATNVTVLKDLAKRSVGSRNIKKLQEHGNTALRIKREARAPTVPAGVITPVPVVSDDGRRRRVG